MHHITSHRLQLRVALIAMSVAACGQSVEENRFYLLGSGESLTELPLETGTSKSTANAGARLVGVGKFRTFVELVGLKAPVRLSSGQPQNFVLGTNPTVPLPAHLDNVIYTRIEKLDVNVKSGMREWLFSSSTSGSVLYHKSKGYQHTPTIALDFERYGDHGIKIHPRIPLPTGEYCFPAQAVTRDPYARSAFLYRCFGVD